MVPEPDFNKKKLKRRRSLADAAASVAIQPATETLTRDTHSAVGLPLPVLRLQRRPSLGSLSSFAAGTEWCVVETPTLGHAERSAWARPPGFEAPLFTPQAWQRRSKQQSWVPTLPASLPPRGPRIAAPNKGLGREEQAAFWKFKSF